MDTNSIAGTILPIYARIENGIIHTEMNDKELAESVLDRKNIIILRSVFSKTSILALRKQVWDWSRDRKPTTEYNGNGFTTRQINAEKRAPLFCRTWWFLDLDGMDPVLRENLYSFFEPLRNLQNRLAGTQHEFTRNDTGMRLRPQIVQYPGGGGNFGSHFHPFLPQKIGLIVALSEQGPDYSQGGTYFIINGNIVQTEGHHQIGDITIFRYDLEHGVSTVDPEKQTDWTSDLGRWTMVLPFKDS